MLSLRERSSSTRWFNHSATPLLQGYKSDVGGLFIRLQRIAVFCFSEDQPCALTTLEILPLRKVNGDLIGRL